MFTKENFWFGCSELFFTNFYALENSWNREQGRCKLQQSEEFMERIRLDKESALMNRLGNGMDSRKSKDD